MVKFNKSFALQMVMKYFSMGEYHLYKSIELKQYQCLKTSLTEFGRVIGSVSVVVLLLGAGGVLLPLASSASLCASWCHTNLACAMAGLGLITKMLGSEVSSCWLCQFHSGSAWCDWFSACYLCNGYALARLKLTRQALLLISWQR